MLSKTTYLSQKINQPTVNALLNWNFLKNDRFTSKNITNSEACAVHGVESGYAKKTNFFNRKQASGSKKNN